MNKRFFLQKSTTKEGYWIFTDAENGVVISFKEGYLNETQEVTFLDDIKHPDAMAIARILREMGDWLATNHPQVAIDAKQRTRESIGEMFTEERQRQGLTVRQLAEKAGISPSQLSKIENGRVNPTIDIISAIANALGFDVEVRKRSE